MGPDKPCFPGVFNGSQLVFLDGDRFAVEAAGAGRLAQGRADPAGEFGEVVGLEQPLDGVSEVAGIDQIVPLGDQVVQRTAGNHAVQDGAGLAEGDAALHAAGSLPPALLPA